MNTAQHVATSTNLDWMLQVGVPGVEVLWLKNMAGDARLSHPVAIRRVKQIQEMAYAGLVASMNVQSITRVQ